MNTKENAGENTASQGCTDKQEYFVKSVQELLKIALDNNDLRHQVAQHDKRLTAHDSRIMVVEVAQLDSKEAVESLRSFFLNQNMTIVDSVGDLKSSVDAMMAHVTPMVKREEKLKAFILKWSLPTIFILLSIIFFGGYAATLGQFVKAVIG